MSASRQKRERKASPAQTQEQKKGMSSTGKWILGIVIAVVALAIIAGAYLITSGWLATHTTAVTVGEHKITPAEYNYNFRDVYYSMSQSAGDSSQYLSLMTDVIKTQTETRLAQTYAVYDAAVAEGYELTEEEKTAIDDEIGGLGVTATAYGYGSVNALLSAMYGAGSTTESFRQYRQVSTLAARYSQDKQDEYLAGADADAYYKEHIDDFTTVTYRQFLVAVTDSRTLDQAKEAADLMVETVTGHENQFDVVASTLATDENKEFYSREDATLLTDIAVSDISEDTRGWLTDPDREYGDVTAIPASDDRGVFVVFYVSGTAEDYDLANVRHLLVTVAEDADAETKAAAKAKAQSYLDEYLAGDKTEESFAELARQHSEDNAGEGGLYEHVEPGQMVAEFNDWIFDPARKTGDVDIVETQYGYHVMYFVGFESKLQNDIKTAMESEFYNTWVGELAEGYEVQEDSFGMRYVNTTINS